MQIFHVFKDCVIVVLPCCDGDPVSALRRSPAESAGLCNGRLVKGVFRNDSTILRVTDRQSGQCTCLHRLWYCQAPVPAAQQALDQDSVSTLKSGGLKPFYLAICDTPEFFCGRVQKSIKGTLETSFRMLR